MFASRIRDWKRLEKITVESWLRKWSGNGTFRKVWLPLLKAKLGDAYQRTSAAFIWAYIDRMYKARRSGVKREMFGYVPGGYAKILSSLRRKLIADGVTIETNSPVEKISKLDGGDGFEVHVVGNCNCKFDFDRVLVTLPSQAIKKICPQLNSEEVAKLDAIEYLGVVCTSVLLKKPLAGYYVTNILDSWVPFTGIIEMGSILPPEKLGGNYLVYLPTYMASTDERLNDTDETIHERCISTLERMYSHFDRSQVVAIQTARAKRVMAIPTLNYSDNLPPLKSSLPGLYLLNSARIVKGTLNVNETIELMHEEMDSTVWPDHLSLATCGSV
jgi:protoporphyrinogen oxidase